MTSKEKECLNLQKVIGYNFKDENLLLEALSHSSYVNERKMLKIRCYERLEFLGDAVLELVSSTLLFNAKEDLNEGQLSKMRASLVCEKALAPCARRIQLGSYILLGHGERMNHGEERDSILCDVIEAVLGAVYLDGGFDAAKTFAENFILNEEAFDAEPVDYKTQLQEIVQASFKENVIYEVVSSSGPDHNKSYEVCVRIADRVYGRGIGSSKKSAEQSAAKETVELLKTGRN